MVLSGDKCAAWGRVTWSLMILVFVFFVLASYRASITARWKGFPSRPVLFILAVLIIFGIALALFPAQVMKIMTGSSCYASEPASRCVCPAV